jgi:hypothetical protein
MTLLAATIWNAPLYTGYDKLLTLIALAAGIETESPKCVGLERGRTWSE